MNTPTPVDPTPWVTIVCDWFGFPTELFDGYRMFQTNPKQVNIVAIDHEHPTKPEPMSSGINFMRINLRFPKMSTSAAMLFGHAATKQYIDLDRAETDAYFKRQTLKVDPSRLDLCNGNGYVLLRHEGHTLGMGLLLWAEDKTAPADVQSLFPKAHALRDERSAFGAPAGV